MMLLPIISVKHSTSIWADGRLVRRRTANLERRVRLPFSPPLGLGVMVSTPDFDSGRLSSILRIPAINMAMIITPARRKH